MKIKNIVTWRDLGDAFENEDGTLEFFTKTHGINKVHLFDNVIFIESTMYDNEDGYFHQHNLDIPLEELRELNRRLVESGIDIV